MVAASRRNTAVAIKSITIMARRSFVRIDFIYAYPLIKIIYFIVLFCEWNVDTLCLIIIFGADEKDKAKQL